LTPETRINEGQIVLNIRTFNCVTVFLFDILSFIRLRHLGGD